MRKLTWGDGQAFVATGRLGQRRITLISDMSFTVFISSPVVAS
jgi:hypothetical protein